MRKGRGEGGWEREGRVGKGEGRGWWEKGGKREGLEREGRVGKGAQEKKIILRFELLVSRNLITSPLITSSHAHAHTHMIGIELR